MPYQDDWLETLGDILPRMKPLQNPPGADEEQQARTQQHNEALAQLQDNALVARHLAQNTITNGVPFPDSLVHFVPGRLLGPLAAARANGNNDPWVEPSSTGSSDDTADPWESYGKSAFATGNQNSNMTMPPPSGSTPAATPAPQAASSTPTNANSGLTNIPVPPAPPGVDIIENMNGAKAHRYYPDALKYLWFYNQVHNRAPWDYKQSDIDKTKYAPFGNFNYGATGAMLRIPQDVLLRMAGVAQKRAGNSSPAFGSNPGPVVSLLGVGGVAPYGDDPVDQMFIKQGFQYAQPFVSPPVVLTDRNGVPLYR